jgi:hypothetical protein
VLNPKVPKIGRYSAAARDSLDQLVSDKQRHELTVDVNVAEGPGMVSTDANLLLGTLTTPLMVTRRLTQSSAAINPGRC